MTEGGARSRNVSKKIIQDECTLSCISTAYLYFSTIFNKVPFKVSRYLSSAEKEQFILASRSSQEMP